MAASPSRSILGTALILATCLTLYCLLFAATAQAQRVNSFGRPPSENRDFYIGSSMFMLANLVPMENPPKFYQLNAGIIFTPVDRLSVEAISWRYYHPLGIPYGGPKEAPEEAYPGHIRERGVGLAYQRFLSGGFYTSLAVIPFRREFYDTQGKKIVEGSYKYMILRFGYKISFFNRLFMEPSIAFNRWWSQTNTPAEFEAKDRKWPNYFLFEPGLHVGIEF